MTEVAPEVFPRAGFRRRLGAWIYDFLLAFAVYMLAGAVAFLLFNILIKLSIIDKNGFDHAIDLQKSSLLYSTLIYVWSTAWVSYFFIYFWTKTGQTLGMRAWRLRVQNVDGSLISSKTALKRLILTLLGLGNFAVLVDRKNKLSLQDRITKTEVVVLSMEANRGRL